MYRAEFFESDDLVLTLEIEGENRCEILSNILEQEWTQDGHFIIEEHDIDEIIFNLLLIQLNKDPDIDIYDHVYLEYLEKAEFYSKNGLTLSSFLDQYNKEINAVDIFDLFCESIRLKFEYDNDTLSIDYNVERI
jgi:hypothetical protein